VLLQNEDNTHAQALLDKMEVANSDRAVQLAAFVFSNWRNLGNQDTLNVKAVEEESSNFYFNCMVGLAVAGASLLVVAMLLNPASPFMVLAIVGGAALLTSAGMFAADKLSPDNNNKVGPSPKSEP
ncbi:MAG: hypothetical protein QNK11_09270, partial [Legionella sp.]|nr:hypothetical protein [Legionella sp.]